MSETQTPSNEDFMRDFVALQRKVADISNAAVGGAQFVTGDLIPAFGTTRAGAVLCDGTSYLDTDPIIGADLAALLRSVPALVVDGTHVKVPDYRGCAIAGADGATFIIGAETGVETVTLTAAMSGMPAHTHPGGGAGTTGAGSAHTHTGSTGVNNVDHTHTYNIPAAIASGSTPNSINAGSISNSQTTSGESTTHTHTLSINSESAHTHSFTDPTTGSAGGGSASTPHTNVQPTLPANVFIKT